ncbi:MAG TPA: hypothetical protein VHY08_12120 [Bacillota bacterium]|nr:hypothetical protein [Bacillota bacterium]
MYQKSFIPLMGLMLLFVFAFVTVACMATPSPFSLNYSLELPVAVGTGSSGEMILALTNTAECAVRDIIIRLPKDAWFFFGPYNQYQAGTLKPGEQTVISQHFFDPQGIIKKGTLAFIIDYTTPDGIRRATEIAAVGNMEVSHE